MLVGYVFRLKLGRGHKIFLHLFIVCVYVCEHMQTCHTTHVEIRGQLAGSSLLCHVGCKDQSQNIIPGSKLLYPQSHLTDLRESFFELKCLKIPLQIQTEF